MKMSTSSMQSGQVGATEEVSWESLRNAIAETSGFRSWQLEQQGQEDKSPQDLDYWVRRYLRETLATLAY